MNQTLPEERKNVIAKLFIFLAGIYFIQGLCQGGISGLFSLPLSFMLRDKLGFDQSQLAYFRGLVLIPWAIKPLYGIISDFIPIFGFRRKSWYILTSILGITSALYLYKYCNYSENQLMVALAISAMSFAFADVLCDAVMVENGKLFGLTDKFQAVQWASISGAAILAGIGGGIIATYCGYSQMFLIMSLPSFAVLIIAIFFVPEKKYQYLKLAKSETASFINRRDLIWVFGVGSFVYALSLVAGIQSLMKMNIFKFSLFIAPFFIIGSLCFLFRKTVSKITFLCIILLFWWDFSVGINVAPFFYYQTYTLGFSELFMGQLQTYGSIGGLLGALLFLAASRRKIFWKNRFLGETSLVNLLKLAGLIGIIFIVSNFFLMGVKSAVVLTVTMFFIYQFARLVMLVLAAEFCPKQIEGTFFALLMSVCNLGASMAERASGVLFGFLKTIAPNDYASNYWAKFLVWLGWPIQHADPKTPYDLFISYYAIGWLIIISLGAFLIYFLFIRCFGNSIKEREELKKLDIYSVISGLLLKIRLLTRRLQDG